MTVSDNDKEANPFPDNVKENEEKLDAMPKHEVKTMIGGGINVVWFKILRRFPALVTTRTSMAGVTLSSSSLTDVVQKKLRVL
jgi:hypothetical protein